MKKYPEEVSHQVLLDEIRLNRADIKGVNDKLGSKVGRGELFGWLGVLGTVIGTVILFV